jgi:hypothetical protein
MRNTKKMYALALVIVTVLAANGCARDNVNNDYNNDMADEYGDNLGFYPPENPDNLPTDESVTPQGTVNENYLASVRGIDDTLRNSISDANLTKADPSDSDYLTKQRDYYNNTASAYKKALDDLKGLDYNDNDTEYYNALTGYYQRGYDMYNAEYDRYGTFNTLDDERTYLDTVGDNYLQFDDAIKRTYDDALRGLGVNRDQMYGSNE